MKPLVFISHKHSDAKIASALSTWVTQVSGNSLEIFQSSDGLRSTPGMGRALTDEIKAAAFRASLMFVIYTEPDDEWDWVMYEVGLAHEPTEPETRIVLVQCGAAAPAVLRDKARLTLSDEQSRISFAKEFLTTQYFKDHPPLAEFAESYVQAQAASLWTLVGPTIPKSLQLEPEWSPHPMFRLQLALSELPDNLECGTTDDAGALRLAAFRAKVVSDENAGIRVLRRQSLQGMTLEQMAQVFSNIGTGWIETLVGQIADCLCRRLPDPPGGSLVSPVDTQTYVPVVLRVRWRQFENVVRFDVVLVQLVNAPKH